MQTWTEEELLALPGPYKYELVDGELITMAPAGIPHGDIIMNLAIPLGAFIRTHKLGYIFEGQTGFYMKSGNLYCPDLSFLSAARFKGYARLPEGFFRGSPDLAVEVLSPRDSRKRLALKIEELFDNDTRLAWVVDPEDKTVTVYHSAQADRTLHENDTIDGEQIVPGFALPVARLFAGMEFQ